MDVIGNMCYNKFYNNSIVIIINQNLNKIYEEILIQLSGNRSFTLLADPFHILG